MKSTFFALLVIINFLADAQETPHDYFEKAGFHKSNQQPDSAIFYYKLAASGYYTTDSVWQFIASLNQAGVILTRQDRYDEAKIVLDSALYTGLKQAVVEPELAVSYITLGVLYAAQDEFSKSLENHFAALNIRLNLLGYFSSETGTSYGNIGNVFFRMAAYDSAIFYHKKALEIRDSLFGPVSFEITQTYLNLGNAYRELKDYTTAIYYFELALSCRITLRGTGHRDLIPVYEKLAEAHALAGNSEKSSEYKRLAEEIKMQC